MTAVTNKLFETFPEGQVFLLLLGNDNHTLLGPQYEYHFSRLSVESFHPELILHLTEAFKEYPENKQTVIIFASKNECDEYRTLKLALEFHVLFREKIHKNSKIISMQDIDLHCGEDKKLALLDLVYYKQTYDKDSIPVVEEVSPQHSESSTTRNFLIVVAAILSGLVTYFYWKGC